MRYFFSCKALFLVIAAVFFCNSSGAVCPPSRLTRPCNCKKACPACEVILQCKELMNQIDLAEVLERSSDYVYDKLDIHDSSFSYLPASLFERKDLKTIDIWYSSMSAFLQTTLPSTHTLESLTFLELKIMRGLQWQQLAPFTNLKRLSVLHMILPRLGDAFQRYVPKTIEHLMLYNTSTVQLDDAVFASMKDLQELALQHGKVETVKRSMFPENCKLTSIDFNQNLIETLPEDLFSNMPLLRTIRLPNNRIKEITKDTFGDVFTQLYFLYLEGNPIRCGCSTRWLSVVGERPRTFEGKCSEPLELEGRDLRDLRQEDFVHCRS